MCAEAGIEVVELPADRLTEIAPGVEIYAVLHETNGVDASLAIRNAHFSVYHGNDNYVSAPTLQRLKDAVGRVDVACVPFAYIHWYPFLLEGVDPGLARRRGAAADGRLPRQGGRAGRDPRC